MKCKAPTRRVPQPRPGAPARTLTVEDYVAGRAGPAASILARAITSGGKQFAAARRRRHDRCCSEFCRNTGNAKRIGITGVPGVGKSTFIEAFGLYLVERRATKSRCWRSTRAAHVLAEAFWATKPAWNSSAANPTLLFAPRPSGETLGGVARRTRETVFLCEAAGFDTDPGGNRRSRSGGGGLAVDG